MYSYFVTLILITAKVPELIVGAVKIDIMNCGADDSVDVAKGTIDLETYAWLGILYYYYDGDLGDTRAVTPVALIHAEFVVGAAADIGPMPKDNFRKYSRVLLGESWAAPGRRIANYVLHPEYGKHTYNTLALVQLRDGVRNKVIAPLCPPPDILRNPEFYVVKFDSDFEVLKKEVIPVSHVPGNMCKDFYVAANLYEKRMRPPHVVCAVSLDTTDVCVWDAGAALVARDVWGRWQLLGVGVRGPGCGAPARFLDMLSYAPWLRDSLDKFQRFTISKINNHKYVLRSGGEASYYYQRFGACDAEEKVNLIYREYMTLRTDNQMFQFYTFNVTIYENVEYSCLTFEIHNASATSEMRVTHFCPRQSFGPPCYAYRGSVMSVSVYIMFSDKCSFEMFAWGWKKQMMLIDKLEWKWEEGTYYEDFALKRVEYRGPGFMTLYGFEPIDLKMWVPDYDLWTTTQFDNSSFSSTTVSLPREEPVEEIFEYSRTPSYKQMATTRPSKGTPPPRITTTTQPRIPQQTTPSTD